MEASPLGFVYGAPPGANCRSVLVTPSLSIPIRFRVSRSYSAKGVDQLGLMYCRMKVAGTTGKIIATIKPISTGGDGFVFDFVSGRLVVTGLLRAAQPALFRRRLDGL